MSKITTKYPPPDTKMVKRICGVFDRTWSVIASDMIDCYAEQARFDKASQRVMQRGYLTKRETYDSCIDYIEMYGHDDEAIAEWNKWHEADYEGSRKTIVAGLFKACLRR